jgi:hypothetical protein
MAGYKLKTKKHVISSIVHHHPEPGSIIFFEYPLIMKSGEEIFFYSGMFPCFFGGFCFVLFWVSSNAWKSLKRVCFG